ncbi:glycerophosphodiester phosphodiesterase [Alkalihalobacillus sp. 1P02AB]|uniref:glycerophosphodiester phosphodiesterase n=1 Tax=Alkalihalobacillus sp. 1P02AB TaxID=3132260 RepID=UPI0039A4DC0C
MKKSLKRMVIVALSIGLVVSGLAPSASAQKKDESLYPVPASKILNVAHRGASGYAPEHTLVAYEMGEKMKADYIEIDLQMTKDGVLIAMHDTNVDRTTNGSGAVADMTLEEIKELDAGSWFNERNPEKAKSKYVGLKVPTLEEVFRKFGRSSLYYIETKSPELYPGMEAELLRLLDKYNLAGVNGRSSKVMIQSFIPESLINIHEMNPNLPLVQLLSQPVLDEGADAQLEAIKEYAIGVGPSFTRITEEYVQKVHSHNLYIHPYTVNTREAMERALDWGVNGLFTDYPDVFREVIKEHKKR